MPVVPTRQHQVTTPSQVTTAQDTDQHHLVDVDGDAQLRGQQALPTSLPTTYAAILESENKDFEFQLV